MKKVLFVATTAKTHINLFHIPYIKWFKNNGWIVDVATNGDAKVLFADNEYTIAIERSPINFRNIKACKQLIDIMKKGQYNLISCHTPMGGVLARIAAYATNVSPVMYTAHGFHFYKGASPIKNIIFKGVEGLLARWTDILITINEEDYQAARRFHLRKNGRVYKIDGIGVDIFKFKRKTCDKNQKRKELGILEDAVVFTNIGELIKRKNHETLIRAFARTNIENSILIICGDGELKHKLQRLVKSLKAQQKIILLGFRTDIDEILSVSDVFVFPSYQEGLPVSVIEAMAVGLPVICSDIRGCSDLIDDGGGMRLKPHNIAGFAEAMKKMSTEPVLRKTCGENNKSVVHKYDLSCTLEEMASVISEFV